MRKKKVTRLLALIMSSAILIFATACGNKNQQPAKNSTDNAASSGTQESTTGQEGSVGSGSELEPVTLRIFMYDKASPDDAAVAAYVNSLPQVQALNVTIEIVKQPGGGPEHYEKIPLLLTTNEQMDIGFDAAFHFTDRVRQGAYADISEFVKNDPDFYNSIPEEYWTAVTYNDGIYAVPTHKDYVEQWAFYTDSYILEKYNIDPASITGFQDAEVILEAEKQEGDRAPFMVSGSTAGFVFMSGMKSDYDFLNGVSYLAVAPEEGKTIVNPYETEEFFQLVQTMYDWNKKGYIHPDALTSTNVDEDYTIGGLKNGLSIVSSGGRDYVLDDSVLAKYGWDNVTTLPISGDPVITNNATRGSLFGIYEKCANKERAYEFLKLWNTDSEVKNAIYLGIPDQHYTVENGKAVRVDKWDELYHSRNWTTGNNTIAMLTANEPDDTWEKNAEAAQKARAAADLGMFMVSDTIADKQAVVESVITEYLPPLMLGYVEPETGIAQLVEQMRAAGIDELIAEVQEQFDEFLASK